jgi:hypothetical protein
LLSRSRQHPLLAGSGDPGVLALQRDRRAAVNPQATTINLIDAKDLDAA